MEYTKPKKTSANTGKPVVGKNHCSVSKSQPGHEPCTQAEQAEQ